jgi:hypothetical protein
MNTLPAPLGEVPSTIGDALEVHARLDALAVWADQRKRAIRGWVDARAEVRQAEDGAAPTWRLGDNGSVLRTDPKPRARITDPEAFGRWYVATLLDRDPDEPHPDRLHRFDDSVARHTVATVRNSPTVLDLIDRLAELGTDLEQEVAPAWVLAELEDGIDVDTHWVLAESVLEDMLSGKSWAGADRARLRIVTTVDHDLVVLDTEVGEVVPGVTVTPPGIPQVQMKPSTMFKRRVAEELNELLGPPALPTR